jgi:Domain of unknown function (DUF1848)
MHIISASRRTDIPAFHAEWFMKRIRDCSVEVASPFGGKRFEVSLDPSDVIAIVFWTKNPSPLLPYLDELVERGHCFTFLYTVNNYPIWLEPNVPELGHTLEIAKNMTQRYSSSVIRWRYDTIVLTEVLNRKWHIRNFDYLCAKLSAYVRECIFSFCDYYKKTTRNMERMAPNYYRPDDEECKAMAEELAGIARSRGITLSSCAHDFLVSDSISKARCIDPAFLTQVVDSESRKRSLAELKAAPTRRECGCAASRDIGAYDTCLHGCAYCYANTNPELAARNVALINSNSRCLDPKCSCEKKRVDSGRSEPRIRLEMPNKRLSKLEKPVS